MQTIHRLTVAGLCALIGSVAAQPPVAPGQVAVEDGDTLRVQVAGMPYRIQLPGIDAPEGVMNPKLQRDIGRTGLTAETLLPLGDAAAAGLQRLLPAFRPYRLVFDPNAKDRYGRTPGDLIDSRGRSLSLRMVEAGYALPAHPAAGRDPALQAAAADARQGRRGLWQSHPDIAEAWAAPAAR